MATESQSLEAARSALADFCRACTGSAAPTEKGRLRTFLLGSLQHFMAGEYHRAHALKRDGGRSVLLLDDHLTEAQATVRANAGARKSVWYDQA